MKKERGVDMKNNRTANAMKDTLTAEEIANFKHGVVEVIAKNKPNNNKPEAPKEIKVSEDQLAQDSFVATVGDLVKGLEDLAKGLEL